MTSHQLIHSSKSSEWYTPAWLIERVRGFLGIIDLDPCSSKQANETVQARDYYTRDEQGLARPWKGRVFVNPPSVRGDPTARYSLWVDKMISEVKNGHVSMGILLVPAVPDRQWFHPLWEFPICFLWERIQFDGPPGQKTDQPTHPHALVYMGMSLYHMNFREQFQSLGACVHLERPYRKFLPQHKGKNKIDA